MEREDAQGEADLLVGERDEHQPAGRRRELEGEAHHGGDARRSTITVTPSPPAHSRTSPARAAASPQTTCCGAHRPRVLQALGHPVGQQHGGAPVVGGEADGLADRPGAEDDDPSPAVTRARATVRTPIEAGSTKAVTAGAMSPTAKTCDAGTQRRSCSAPSTWAPMMARLAHAFSRPMLHG